MLILLIVNVWLTFVQGHCEPHALEALGLEPLRVRVLVDTLCTAGTEWDFTPYSIFALQFASSINCKVLQFVRLQSFTEV